MWKGIQYMKYKKSYELYQSKDKKNMKNNHKCEPFHILKVKYHNIQPVYPVYISHKLYNNTLTIGQLKYFPSSR